MSIGLCRKPLKPAARACSRAPELKSEVRATMGVLGGKYSMNPYKLGFYLMLDIEERWNKGRFGQDWDDCKDMRIKEKWNTNAGLGKEKLFEVRKYYNDLTFLHDSTALMLGPREPRPDLTIVVINDNGGTAVAGDFTMDVTGTDVAPASFPGEEDPGTEVAIEGDIPKQFAFERFAMALHDLERTSPVPSLASFSHC